MEAWAADEPKRLPVQGGREWRVVAMMVKRERIAEVALRRASDVARRGAGEQQRRHQATNEVEPTRASLDSTVFYATTWDTERSRPPCDPPSKTLVCPVPMYYSAVLYSKALTGASSRAVDTSVHLSSAPKPSP